MHDLLKGMKVLAIVLSNLQEAIATCANMECMIYCKRHEDGI